MIDTERRYLDRWFNLPFRGKLHVGYNVFIHYYDKVVAGEMANRRYVLKPFIIYDPPVVPSLGGLLRQFADGLRHAADKLDDAMTVDVGD